MPFNPPEADLINIVLKERTNGGNTRVNLTQTVNAGFTTGGISASYNKGRSEFAISYNPNRRDYGVFKSGYLRWVERKEILRVAFDAVDKYYRLLPPDGYFVIPVMPCDALVRISAIGLRRVERHMVVEGNKNVPLRFSTVL